MGKVIASITTPVDGLITSPLPALAGHGVALDRVSVEGDPRSAGRYMVTRVREGRLGPGALRLDPARCTLGEQMLPLQYLGVGRSYGDAPGPAAGLGEREVDDET